MCLLKRKYKQWWSVIQTIPLISIRIKKTTKYDVENSGPALEQAQKSDEVKPVNGIPICIFVSIWENVAFLSLYFLTVFIITMVYFTFLRFM